MSGGAPPADPTRRLEIVIATANAGKLREIRALLAGLPVVVRSLADYPAIGRIVEDADSFAGNAERKARAVHARTGLVAVADDSGLVVDALGGAPGVRSARYAGEGASDRENNDKLLTALAGVPPERRTARFVCDVCVYPVRGQAIHRTGEVRGVILDEPRGTGGFGYDPLFWYPEEGRTFAELPDAVKNRVSHRARAFAGLAEVLAPLLAEPGCERR